MSYVYKTKTSRQHNMRARRLLKGCTSIKNNPTISFFIPPKANYLVWKLAVSNANCEETVVKYVCAEHFRPEEILNNYLVPHDIPNIERGIIHSIFPLVQEKSNDILSSIKNSNSDHNYAKCSSNQVNKSVQRELFIEPSELDEELPNKCLKLFEDTINEIFTFNDLTIHFKKAVLPE
ncbi:hypothetical protein QTP88_003461 [Uroleucon formosanum]